MTLTQKLKETQVEFTVVKTHDADCRCCGQGRQFVCPVCTDYIKTGSLFLLEIRDELVRGRRKFTGKVIRMKASKLYMNGSSNKSQSMEPGIYIVSKTELKNFLKTQYESTEAAATKQQYASGNRSKPGSTKRPRSIIDLRHDR